MIKVYPNITRGLKKPPREHYSPLKWTSGDERLDNQIGQINQRRDNYGRYNDNTADMV